MILLLVACCSLKVNRIPDPDVRKTQGSLSFLKTYEKDNWTEEEIFLAAEDEQLNFPNFWEFCLSEFFAGWSFSTKLSSERKP